MYKASLTGDALAYATLDYIRAHPDEWDQLVYACGTMACFAGRALILSGTPVIRRNDDFYYPGSGNPLSVRRVAKDLLGWNARESSEVFHNFTQDFSELERTVKDVLDGKYR